MRRPAVFLAALLAAPTLAHAAAEYHWNATAPSFFGNPNSWSPPRTVFLDDDRLVFDHGGSVTATGTPTAPIGQLVIAGNTQVTFQAGSNGNVLTIGGGAGPDLDIQAGSSLALAGTNSQEIHLATGTTGTIAGTFEAVGLAHRLHALDAGSLLVQAGGIVRARDGFSGNLFGIGTGTSGLNAVRFLAGSVYENRAGANPFGASQPASVVVFEAGSLYRQVASNAPSMSGRTYANFEYDGTGSVAVTGGAPLTVDSVVVNTGAFTIGLTSTVHLRGAIHVRTGATLTLGGSGAMTCRLEGATAQAVVDSSTYLDPTGLILAPVLTLVVDNPSGAVTFMRRTLHLPGVLSFAHGVLSGLQTIDLGSTGSVTGASAATGWIDTRLALTMGPGNPSYTFPLGSATTFMPPTITFHNLGRSMEVDGRLFSVLGPEWFDLAQIDTANKANLLWDFSVFDSVWSTYDVTLRFDAPHVNPGGDPSLFDVRRHQTHDPLVFLPVPVGARTATSIEAIGLTRHVDGWDHLFLVGQSATVSVSVQDAAVPEGNGGALVASASSVPFRISLSRIAVEPVAVDYAVSPGTAQAGVDYTPVSGTITFAPGDTAATVDVPILGDGTAEDYETLQLNLTDATGATIDRGSATGTIEDDDDVTPPTATVVSPNGGETLVEGSTAQLAWTATDDVVVRSIALWLSKDDGATWDTIATGLPNTGTYAWTVPVGLTTQARLKVVAADPHDHLGEDVSDAPWRIWGIDGVEPVPAHFAFDLASANPAAGPSIFRLSLTRPEDVRMVVHDVRGRLVGAPVLDRFPAGVQRLDWAGRGAGPGLYFVRVETSEGTAVRRVVRLP